MPTLLLEFRLAELMADHRNVNHWGLSAFHQEFRRRIWANIYILDAYQSVVYGRPPIIQDAECDVVFPPFFPIPRLGPHVPINSPSNAAISCYTLLTTFVGSTIHCD